MILCGGLSSLGCMSCVCDFYHSECDLFCMATHSPHHTSCKFPLHARCKTDWENQTKQNNKKKKQFNDQNSCLARHLANSFLSLKVIDSVCFSGASARLTVLAIASFYLTDYSQSIAMSSTAVPLFNDPTTALLLLFELLDPIHLLWFFFLPYITFIAAGD